MLHSIQLAPARWVFAFASIVLALSGAGCGNSNSPNGSSMATFHGVIPTALLGSATATASQCVYAISLDSGCIELDVTDLGYADHGLVGTTEETMYIGVALTTPSPIAGVPCTFASYSATRDNNDIGGTYAAFTAGGGDSFNSWGFTGAQAGNTLVGTLTINVTTYDLDGAGSYVQLPPLVTNGFVMQSGGCGGSSGGGSAGGSAGGSGGGSGGAGGGSGGGSAGGHAGGSGGGAGGSGSGGGTGPTGPPTINYVGGDSAPGTVGLITGTNFPTDLAEITLTLCGVAAQIDSSDGTTLTFTVPNLNAQSCTLTLTTPLGMVTSGTPFAISLLHHPFGIGVDATSVYWTDDIDGGTVMKVGLDGGAVSTIAAGLDGPLFLALDTLTVYWTEGGSNTVKKVAKTGGAVTTLASGLNGPWGIAVDSSDVYWTESNGGTVKKIAKTGGAVTTLATGQYNPLGIAVDGTGVYWEDNALPGSLMKLPFDAGAPEALATSVSTGSPIALDANRVYWGAYYNLYSIGLDGGAVTTYPFTFSGEVEALGVDAENLYWMAGTINSGPLDGGTAVVLDTNDPSTQSMALDSNHLYWTDQSDATVRKITKDTGSVVTLASMPNVP